MATKTMKVSPLVFVSHANRDKSLVDKLVHALVSNGVRVWYDRWEILVGHDIVDKVYDGIRRADYLAIVLTQQSIRSKWVKEELNAAKMREIEQQRTLVLPLLYEKIQLPPSLTTKRYADFTQSFESGLAELLEVFGISKSNDDMLCQLARVLDQYADEAVRNRWDVFAGAFNRYPVPYIHGNRDANSQSFAKILEKVDAGIENTQAMIGHDYRALASDQDRNVKHENSLWTDSLWNKTWRIAREILDEKQEMFFEDIDGFRGEVASEFRFRVLNDIGPSLANLWTSRGERVVQNAIHVILAILEIEITHKKPTRDTAVAMSRHVKSTSRRRGT